MQRVTALTLLVAGCSVTASLDGLSGGERSDADASESAATGGAGGSSATAGASGTGGGGGTAGAGVAGEGGYAGSLPDGSGGGAARDDAAQDVGAGAADAGDARDDVAPDGGGGSGGSLPDAAPDACGTTGTVGPASPSNAVESGTGNSWVTLDGALASDGTNTVSFFGTSGSETRDLTVSDFRFALPPGATIVGITVEIEKSGGPNLADIGVRLVRPPGAQSSNRASSAPWPVNDAYVVHGGPTDTWGTVWTAAEVAQAGFGVRVRARSVGTGGLEISPAQIDHIRVTVHFALECAPHPGP